MGRFAKFTKFISGVTRGCQAINITGGPSSATMVGDWKGKVLDVFVQGSQQQLCSDPNESFQYGPFQAVVNTS